MMKRYLSTLVLGIRKESKNRWECRAPLTPYHVEKLIKEANCRVIVQPCSKRIFPTQDFVKAGAVLSDDLSQADVILGIKEVPISQLIPNKTYLFFSHTHKGQRHNMPMLNEIMNRKITLIDYELMVNEHKQRLVLFGTFAGFAGMINALNGLGDRLLTMGYHTPFLSLGLAHNFISLNQAKKAIRDVGDFIKEYGTPRELGPLVFIFTGNGNVSKGAQEMFRELPHTIVQPKDLPDLVKNKEFDAKRVYGCIVTAKDYAKRTDGGQFEISDFMTNPQNYTSNFHDKIAPYATMLVNGIYWDSRFPRLLTTDQVTELYVRKNLRLLSIADISCDIKGPIEFMDRASTMDQPFFYYDIDKKSVSLKCDSPGIQIMSIDNLPTQLPKESSDYFGKALYPFVMELVKGNYSHRVLKGATITECGNLTKPHEQLKRSVSEVIKNSATKNILVLGSGMVAGPLVDFLANFSNYKVTIASNNIQEARNMVHGRANVVAKPLDIQDKENLYQLVEHHDIVISFIPATLHLKVAETCIALKKSMVTASYVTPQIASLHEKAIDAGIVIFKEIGLDPGIDHLTAMKIIDEAKDSGFQIEGFTSWCGGLPAPENSDNPLGYKFSWSPRGVLLAALNAARYRQNGELIEIPGENLLQNAQAVSIYPGFNFEGLPNRDSLKYEKAYGLDGISTMFRGTLRYKGFSELMSCYRDLGLLNPEEMGMSGDMSWNLLLQNLLGASNKSQLVEAIRSKLRNRNDGLQARCVESIKWLGLMRDDLKVGEKLETPLDALCSIMSRKMAYNPGERDLVCLHHIFKLRKQGRLETRTSTLVAYGQPLGGGYTAMARTVGLPAAIAAHLILQGEIKEKGIVIPTKREIYGPILKQLELEGVHFTEKTIY